MYPQTANVDIVQYNTGEVIQLGGGIVLRVLEDGSHTDNRLGAVHITVPPHTPGPPQHWHQVSSPPESVVIFSDFNPTISLIFPSPLY